MVEEVNKIIYNMLIGGKVVLLPGVGTLYIERQGARRISKDRLLSPRNAVNFSSQSDEGSSIVDEIVAIAGCGEEQARDIYDRWLSKTREGKRLTIGGVGVLNDKSFSPEPGFNAAINPGGVKTLVVRQRNNTWLYAVSGVCAAVALCVGIYMLAGDSLFGGVSVVDGSDAGPVAATVAGDSTQLAQPVTGDSLSAAAAVTPAAEGAAAQQTAVSAQSAPAATTATPSAPTAEETAAASAGYRFWVVAGVFSTEQNASRALEQAAKHIKDMDGRIVPFKGKFIAAVYGSDKRTDCNAFAKSYSDIYPDLWIYEVK
ncbi:MAG: hypothetical protein MR292_01070 [Alistipes sp.]|nr:hypothetical protein [Alistipes sp.]